MPASSLLADGGLKEAQWFQRLEAQHGPERWRLIELALREAVTPVALLNPFVAPELRAAVCESQQLVPHEEMPGVHACPETPLSDGKAAGFCAAASVLDEDEGLAPRPAAALRQLPPSGPRLLPCCFVSGASALGALALEAQPGEAVLDLCAGYGAKALVLAAGVLGAAEGAAAGRLVCNEPSRQRGAVLKDVLGAFLPEELLAKGGPVALTSAEVSHKAPPALARLGPFDKVLVDVPCSALRKMAKQQRVKVGGHLNLVSPALWECNQRTVKANAELAEQLLRCAADLVRPGGLVVYCTTSLEERENDAVVKKFLQRMRDEFEIIPGEDDAPIGGAEATELGTMLLPDQGTLHGPLYLARLRRRGPPPAEA